MQNHLNWEDIQRFRVKQDWFFDKESFQMESKVIGIAPMRIIYNEDGSERGDQPLFWFFFDSPPKTIKE